MITRMAEQYLEASQDYSSFSSLNYILSLHKCVNLKKKKNSLLVSNVYHSYSIVTKP